MHVRLDELALLHGRAAVLAGVAHATPWSTFDYVEVDPGRQHALPDAAPPAEEVFVLLAGRAEAQAAGRGVEAAACAVLLAPAGARPRLRNTGPQPLRVLHLGVDLPALEADGQPLGEAAWRAEAVDPARLAWRPGMHGGHGRMATRHLWSAADLASALAFVDHAVLGPHSALGRHGHACGEEAFVVLRGQGLMTVGESSFAVGPGSVTFHALGQGHGLQNPGPAELEFLRLAVAVAGRPFGTIDL